MSNQQTDSTTLRSPTEGVAIGIPAYNEAETVADVVKEATTYAESVIVVDDGSTDQTATRAAAAGATVISHPENRGYGGALKTLFETAHDRDVDHLVVLDADGQHDPADVPDLVAIQRSSSADIVIGSRFVGGSQKQVPLYRRVGLAVINHVVGFVLRFGYSMSRIHDTQSGFRAYDAEIVETLANRSELSTGMDASVDILFQAADEGCEVVEFPVDVTYDVAEANTHNPLVHGAVLVRNVITRVVSDRPIYSLGIPGGVCLLVGTALAGVSLTDSVAVSTVPELVVTLLILGGIALTGVAFAINRAHPGGE
jgi:glycosyltransferase involved in cell wall biosynthesis